MQRRGPRLDVSSITRFLRNRGGNFAVMTALSAPIALALAAFAIDEGALYTERREAQAVVDLAAIAAAADLDQAEAAALQTFQDNGLTARLGSAGDADGARSNPAGPVIKVVRGYYTADPATPVADRFKPGKTPYNAAEVTVRKTGTLYFGEALMRPPTIGASAIATTTAQAAFSVGSRLLKLDGGILNALLGALVGGNVSLSVMDYNSLISADVDVLSFLDALAVQSHITAGTYSDVLASNVTIGQIAAALANTSGIDHTSQLALEAVAAGATNSARIPLAGLVDLGSVGRLGLGQRPAGLSVDASAMSMLTAAAAMANGSNQVQLNLGATIPGLTNTTLAIAIGEPQQFSPWLAVGEKGSVVRTAQTRLKLTASIGVPNPGLGGGIKLLSVNLPLNVEVAYAEARLTDISCTSGQPDSRRVTIAAQPGVAALRLADSDASGFADFTRPQSFHDATIADISLKLLLLSIDLLKVSGSSAVTVGNMAPTTLVFDNADITGHAIKTVSTRDVTRSLTTSLVNNLSLTISAAGLPINVTALLGTVKPAVVALLSGVTEPVDTLLYNVLAALGIGIGQADVQVTGAVCGRAVLVQ